MFSNVMKTVPVTGSTSTISFFEDDTIETVRQHVALVMKSHPDRLFIEVRESYPKDWYENPKHWTALFYRISLNKDTASLEQVKTYLEQVRLSSDVSPREITLAEWEARPEELSDLFAPHSDFQEWRILGVADSQIMPLPPTDLPAMNPTQIPQPKRNAIFESFHRHSISEIRGTEIPLNASQLVMRNYYPFLKEDTPINIEALRESITSTHTQIERLLALDVPTQNAVSILKARWYIPFVSTRFNLPRVRFEQIFYGLTVSPETPYVGYFTSKQEKVRHKFYVEDPKNKVPFVDTGMWTSWVTNTQPQRKLPTLLFYRGTSKHTFQRIAVTPKDISISTFRDKNSTESLKDLQKGVAEWLSTLDALVPFLTPADIQLSRWNLSEMAIVATYDKKITEFDMRRSPCLQSVFSYDKERSLFRFMRTDSSEFSQLEVRAFQVLNDATNLSDRVGLLVNTLKVNTEEATRLVKMVEDLDDDFDIEKTLKEYPVVKFSPDEVVMTFVTSLERILKYVNALRYILTTDTDDAALNEVCPRRAEVVEARMAIPAQKIDANAIVEQMDDEMMDILGLDEPAEVAEVINPPPPVAAEEQANIKVTGKKQAKTYNYFNTLIRKFDPTIRKDYPGKCDKLRQVVVITPQRKAELAALYNYTGDEELALEGPNGPGTAICPPYWCMKDEIPLREDQLVDNKCPVCGGKVRSENEDEDIDEFTVIQRNMITKYPDFSKKAKVPCCYVEPKGSEVIKKDESKDELYVLKSVRLDGLRLAYLPEGYLGIETNYKKSIVNGRITTKVPDMFRIGIGSPSKTLPILLNDKQIVPRPRDAPEKIKACSFFRTWKEMGEGETQNDRIISSIDKAFVEGTLGVMEELEYSTLFFGCKVFRIVGDQVVCGFWVDTFIANSRTIAVTETGDIIGRVERREKSTLANKFKYSVDIREDKKVYALLNELTARACASNVPGLQDALKEIQSMGITQYQAILDPFGRIQALLVPSQVLFPIQPIQMPAGLAGVPTRSGYSDVTTVELPPNTDYFTKAVHPGYKVVHPLKNANGMIVEVLLSSGFHVPIQPVQGEIDGNPGEIVDTVRKHNERDLIDALPNKEDIRLAEQISYGEEVYQFLLFSLSKDLSPEDTEYEDLRKSIAEGSESMYIKLESWLSKNAYWDDVVEPVKFVNKVRAPCGQMKEESCKSSSLCGWHANSCKIKIKSTELKKSAILRRIVKSMKENNKQRSLVLDGRLSPFFSTILYLEMPHELITTSI
jgi:hypothetical protein